MNLDLDAELALALELADRADAETLPRFRSGLRVDRKSDHSEVTEADRAAEWAIRTGLAAARPDHAILGEEHGLEGDEAAACRWIIDPIDATSNFVRNIPVWGTLLALDLRGEIVVGVVSAPALGRRWWAVRGGGAFADGVRLQVSATDDVAMASISYPDLRFFAEDGRGAPMAELATQAWRSRGFGDFYQHVLVAEGGLDVAVDPRVAVWDVAPLQVIVEEAGGVLTDLDGNRRVGGSAVSSNGRLHRTVVDALRPT